MRMELTEEQQAFREAFRSFVDSQIIPEAPAGERDGKLPQAVISRLAEQGYLGAMLPREFGGMGLDHVRLGIMLEELGRGWTAAQTLLTVHGMAALAIERWGTAEQRSRWLPALASGQAIGAFALSEPDVGSDAKSVQTRATLRGDHYVISGQKQWITMGQIADLILLIARVEEKPTAFLVERNAPGLTIQPVTGMLGMRASMLATLTLEECHVPAENLVGAVGAGLSHVALSCLDYGRFTIACGCVGLAQACLEASVAYGRSRRQFGEPLGNWQLVKKMIAEMVVGVQAARLLCMEAAYQKDALDPDSIVKTWMAKYFASTMLQKVASDAVQIHGANGCSSEYPIERYFRDAKISEIIEGTTQMHEVLIANHALQSMGGLGEARREGGAS